MGRFVFVALCLLLALSPPPPPPSRTSLLLQPTTVVAMTNLHANVALRTRMSTHAWEQWQGIPGGGRQEQIAAIDDCLSDVQ
jgi:hypothetical protein